MEKEEEEALLYDIKNDCFTYSKIKREHKIKSEHMIIKLRTSIGI